MLLAADRIESVNVIERVREMLERVNRCVVSKQAVVDPCVVSGEGEKHHLYDRAARRVPSATKRYYTR